MATYITDECISCGACEPECPNEAITEADDIYVIDASLCTECVGFHDEEACQASCPVDCCIPDPNKIESESMLFDRAKEIHPNEDFDDLDESTSRFRNDVHQLAEGEEAGARVAD